MTQKSDGAERRRFTRIKKNYILRFCQKDNPSLKFELSQIENISKGGICFSSTIPFHIGDTLAIELRTPYITDIIYMEGHILEAKEKVKGLIFQNRLQFLNLSPLAIEVLEKIEKYNTKGDRE